MVILAFAERRKVVASLKVMLSEAPADVCTVSFRKMSSFSFSAIESLLRMTVAVPVMVATLPIGSPAGAAAGAGGGVPGVGACGEGAGWAWASRVRPGSA